MEVIVVMVVVEVVMLATVVALCRVREDVAIRFAVPTAVRAAKDRQAVWRARKGFDDVRGVAFLTAVPAGEDG